MGSVGTSGVWQTNNTLRKVAKRIKNLKKEQYYIIDKDGNISLKKQGGAQEVSATVGEKRDFLRGNVSIHNHPSGGTFSAQDLRDFGFGATDIFVSSNAGVYSLTKTTTGTPDWVHLQQEYSKFLDKDVYGVSYLDRLRQARENTKDSASSKTISRISNEFERIRNTQGSDTANRYFESMRSEYDSATKAHSAEVQREADRLLTLPAHKWLQQNASRYGFRYRLTNWD